MRTVYYTNNDIQKNINFKHIELFLLSVSAITFFSIKRLPCCSNVPGRYTGICDFLPEMKFLNFHNRSKFGFWSNRDCQTKQKPRRRAGVAVCLIILFLLRRFLFRCCFLCRCFSAGLADRFRCFLLFYKGAGYFGFYKFLYIF